jgi:hypothetical protein
MAKEVFVIQYIESSNEVHTYVVTEKLFTTIDDLVLSFPEFADPNYRKKCIPIEDAIQKAIHSEEGEEEVITRGWSQSYSHCEGLRNEKIDFSEFIIKGWRQIVIC